MSKKYVDMVLKKIAKSLDIGDDLFEKAENEYKDWCVPFLLTGIF